MGFPQEPLFIKIFLCDMFFVMNGIDFASYADDNTPYVSSDSIEDVIRILENDSIKLFKWFSDNMMKANKDKCHVIVSSNEHISMKCDLEFIASITKIVDFYLQKFENLFIIDDLNMATENTHLNDLLQIYDLTGLIKEPTCYQSQNPNCIDQFLTRRKALFKHCQTFETGLSKDLKRFIGLIKKFDNECFSNALREELETLEGDTYGEFEKKITNVLNTHATIKIKMIRFNNNVFMTEELRKEIMKRSKLRNKFNRNRNRENWYNFKFQRNYCVNLLRKTKKQYYENLSVKNVMDNQTFWKTVKPYFSDKGSNSRRITLLENDSILTDDKDIAKTMNIFFINITKNLNLKPHKDSTLIDINGITSNFDNHISIKKIISQT